MEVNTTEKMGHFSSKVFPTLDSCTKHSLDLCFFLLYNNTFPSQIERNFISSFILVLKPIFTKVITVFAFSVFSLFFLNPLKVTCHSPRRYKPKQSGFFLYLSFTTSSSFLHIYRKKMGNQIALLWGLFSLVLSPKSHPFLTCIYPGLTIMYDLERGVIFPGAWWSQCQKDLPHVKYVISFS